MKKKLFVLTAAGFSQAYLKYDNKELSSANINDALENKELFVKYYCEIFSQPPSKEILKIQSLYKKIWESLQNKDLYYNQDSNPNFETVFYILNYLCQMQNPDKFDGINHTFFLPKLISYVKPEWNECFSIEDFYDFKNFLLAYVSKFTATDSDLLKVNKFITKLKDDYTLRYYTLNYDNLFLKAVGKNIEKITGTGVPDDINFGFDIATDNIVPSKIFSNHKQHCCFQLHGSINYGISCHTCTFLENEVDALKSRIKYIPEELNTGEVRDRSSLIIGYDKDKIMNLEPYSSFHLKMALDLLDSDKILILGYAFNDEHINKWLMRLTTPLTAPYYQCEEVSKSVIESRATRVKNICIVDDKTDGLQQQQFKDKFLTIARSSGERNLPSGYNELRTDDIEGLKFNFNGVDSFINEYIENANTKADS